MRLGALALMALLPCLGCVSQTGFGKATTLAPGKARVGGGVEAHLVAPKLGPGPHVPLPWAQGTFGYHRGITERVELGGRVSYINIPKVLGTLGGVADMKVQLRRRPPGGTGPDLAAGLALAYHTVWLGGAVYHTLGGALPVLLGIPVAEHQLVLGVRVADYVVTASGQNPVNGFWFGGSLGFAARPKKKTLELFPEIVLLWAPVKFNGESEKDSRVGVFSAQLGFGISYDP